FVVLRDSLRSEVERQAPPRGDPSNTVSPSQIARGFASLGPPHAGTTDNAHRTNQADSGDRAAPLWRGPSAMQLFIHVCPNILRSHGPETPSAASSWAWGLRRSPSP